MSLIATGGREVKHCEQYVEINWKQVDQVGLNFDFNKMAITIHPIHLCFIPVETLQKRVKHKSSLLFCLFFNKICLTWRMCLLYVHILKISAQRTFHSYYNFTKFTKLLFSYYVFLLHGWVGSKLLLISANSDSWHCNHMMTGKWTMCVWVNYMHRWGWYDSLAIPYGPNKACVSKGSG